MSRTVSRILEFLILVLVQTLILSRIALFGYATPMLYILFVLTLGQDLSKNKLMLCGFAIGIVIDVFSNTFGIHAAATTLVAFLRPMLIRLFFLRDESNLFIPGIKTMGSGSFRRYALLAILIHHTVVYMLEYFSFAHPLQLVLHIVCSTLLTLLFVMAVERIISSR